MPCLITAGIAKDCDFLIGGLKALYLANLSDVASYTETVPGQIDAIVMEVGKVFFSFEFEDNTGSFNNELTVSAGQKYVTQSVNFTSATKEKEVIAELKNLALGEFVAIAEDRTGKRFVLGRTNGLEASVQTLGSGAADGDFAGLTVTLTGVDIEYSHVLDPNFDISTIL